VTPAGPALSIVIPFVNSPADLAGCLEAIDTARGAHEVEALVVDRVGNASDVPVARSAWVRLIPAPVTASIPELRLLAFREAQAPVVAVIEDHVLVPAEWIARLLAAFQGGDRVVGGGVVNLATGSLVDWAAFLCEYAPLLPPVPDGPAAALPGNNVAYQRQLLVEHDAIAAEGGWEDRLHSALRRDGVVLRSRSDLTVGHRMHYTAALYTAQRYLFSRSWAGLRVRGAPLAQRLLVGAASAALPPVLLSRVVSTVWRKGLYRRELLHSFPLLVWFTTVWAVGEVVGCLFGPGDATRRVR
jgi:hypothetical protein